VKQSRANLGKSVATSHPRPAFLPTACLPVGRSGRRWINSGGDPGTSRKNFLVCHSRLRGNDSRIENCQPEADHPLGENLSLQSSFAKKYNNDNMIKTLDYYS